MIKGLVIGGTGNIGKLLCETFQFNPTLYRVPEDLEKIIGLSFNYEVVINCIPDINQNILLQTLFIEHSKKNLKTYLITLGSMSYKDNNSEHSKNKLIKLSESILYTKSTVRHTIVNLTWCFNHEKNDIMYPISKSDIINVFQFLLASKDKDSVVSMIEIKGKHVL